MRAGWGGGAKEGNFNLTNLNFSLMASPSLAVINRRKKTVLM